MDWANIGTIELVWDSDFIWHHESCVIIGSNNGLVPDDTKPLPEPMLSYQQ